MADEKKVDEKKKEEIFKKEVEPLIGNTPTVTIQGKEYKMRRIGIVDTFKLARIIGIGAAGLGKEVSSLDISAESAIGLLIVGFPYASTDILELFASLLGVTEEEIKNPNLFPMGSEIEIIKALMGHIDVKAFFTKAVELMKMESSKEFLKKISTLSKKDINTQTKK